MTISGDWFAREAADAENKAEVARLRGWYDLAERFEALANKVKREALEHERFGPPGTEGKCGCCGWYVPAGERACHGDCTERQCKRHNGCDPFDTEEP